YRPLKFGVTRGILREGAGGARYLRADQDLQPHARRMTDRFLHWVEAAPDRSFMARRVRNADGSTGDWKHLTYREAHAAARRIGQALPDRGLGPDRPVAILCENGLVHAMLALGCLRVGVPYCPVSPPYATVSVDYDKLRHVLDTITPGLVFVPDVKRYGKAVQATVPPELEVVVVDGTIEGRKTTAWEDLLATEPTAAVEAAMDRTGPDTITKFLFTSGSTKLPK